MLCMDGALLFAWLGLGIRHRVYLFLIYNMKLASARISFYHWLWDIMLGFGREPRDLYHCVGWGSQARTTFQT